MVQLYKQPLLWQMVQPPQLQQILQRKNIKQFILSYNFKKSVYLIQPNHSLQTGESIRIIADNGNLPENIDPHRVYYAITTTPAGVDLRNFIK